MLQGIFKGLLANARMAVTGRRLIWHVSAIALTFVLVTTGFDWWFYEQTRSTLFNPLIWTAGIGGFFVPVVVPIGMYVAGELWSDQLRKKSLAVLQSILIALAIVCVYKICTGRIQPEFMNTIGNTDISREFQFGFFRNGIFWGWPSSHTAVAVAGGVTLYRLVKNLPVRILTVLYMAIVAVGAAIGFHWLSDVIAGALFGSLIGIVVSKNFR